MKFQQKLDSILYKLAVFWENKRISKKKAGFSLIIIVLLGSIFFQGGRENDLILQVMAAIVKQDDSVDADSNVDSILNYGDDGVTSYLDAQSLDGTDQVIVETTTGGGAGSAIRNKIQQFSISGGRNYFDEYHESWYKNGDQSTVGFPNYEDTSGIVRPLPMDLTIQNITTEDGTVKEWYRNSTDQMDYNISYTGKQYKADGGRFDVIFRKKYVLIQAKKFSILQQPDRVGIYNNNTDEFTKWTDASLPDNMTIASDNQGLTYYNVYNQVDYNITYQGGTLKEIIHSRKDSYPASPYPLGQSYLTFWTQLNFSTDLNIHDRFGEITVDKVVNGILKFKNQLGDVVAFLPIGNAYSDGMPDENVLWRLKKITAKSWYLIGGIRYGWVTHASRTEDIFIDPSWTIGEDGESWGNAVEFYQTMENLTTHYAQLYPSNTTGNITSYVKAAQKNWVKIKYQGDNHGKTVDIYWNSSKDNGISDPFVMQLVQSSASSNTNYTLSVQEKYGSWRLVLSTDTASITPEIYNVTVYNDPPNDQDFTYYKEIEINSDYVDGTQTNFPILVYLASDSDLQNDAQADGDDIAFSNDTAWLDHEIEDFVSGTGELIAWVRIPSLAGATNTTIRMYYGNATMGAQENPEGVWDTNFELVHHLQEDPTTSIVDSTSNNNDLTSVGTMTTADNTELLAQLQTGYDYDGGDDGLGITNNPTDEGTVFTFEGWVEPDASTWGCLVAFEDSGTGEYMWWGISDTGGEWDIWDTGGSQSFTGHDTPNDQVSYSVLVYDGTDCYSYLNGVQSATNGYDPQTDLSDDFYTGHYNGIDPFDGEQDEVRTSRVVRTPSWINTTFQTISNYANFFQLGAEQSVVVPAYRLEWEHQCQNVPYINMDSFNITIYGFSSTVTENFSIQLWNNTASAWLNTTYDINTTEQWYNFSVDTFTGVIGENITWRYLDDLTVTDTVATTLSIDYAGIAYWNYSVDLIETTISLASYNPGSGWENFTENPLELNISSFFDYDIEIRGTDGTGNPVTNEYLRFDTDGDPTGGTNLTVNWQTIYNDQTAGTTQYLFYLFVSSPFGATEQTYTFTLYVRLLKA